MSAAPIIELTRAAVTYPGGVEALKATDLTLREGEFTVLLGRSGAGKSTLLRSLNGLVRVTAGEVSASGLGTIAKRQALRQHRRRTAMIFQQHQLIGRLSVLGNVLTGRLAYHGGWRTLLPLPAAERRLALACLERVDLLEHALRRADHLSGGQQQRVGIARALVQEPTLMLADEPVASLDPATSDEIMGLLHRICRADGIATVVSLHQLELARRFADRIVGIAGGEVIFDGPVAELTDRHLARIYNRPAAAPVPEQEEEPAAVAAFA